MLSPEEWIAQRAKEPRDRRGKRFFTPEGDEIMKPSSFEDMERREIHTHLKARNEVYIGHMVTSSEALSDSSVTPYAELSNFPSTAVVQSKHAAPDERSVPPKDKVRRILGG